MSKAKNFHKTIQLSEFLEKEITGHLWTAQNYNGKYYKRNVYLTMLDLRVFSTELMIDFALRRVLIADWYFTIYQVSQRLKQTNNSTKYPRIQ